MATRANVTSVEAIEAFRSNLIVYSSKARPTLEEVSADVSQIRMWLESDVRIRWQNEVKRRFKKLEEAQNALFSAEISNLRDATTAERLAVNKAKRALEEAEEKLKLVKKWEREFSHRVEPLAKQLEKLHTVLSNTVPEAISHLTEIARALHAYAEIQPASISDLPPEGPSSKTETNETPAEGEKPTKS
jgi:chromosome segregation ATPase